MTSGIFGEKQETARKHHHLARKHHHLARKHHHLYDDETIENMKQYFKVEHEYDALLKYIRGNRILHDSLAEP
jgi:hypothetical protein